MYASEGVAMLCLKELEKNNSKARVYEATNILIYILENCNIEVQDRILEILKTTHIVSNVLFFIKA